MLDRLCAPRLPYCCACIRVCPELKDGVGRAEPPQLRSIGRPALMLPDRSIVDGRGDVKPPDRSIVDGRCDPMLPGRSIVDGRCDPMPPGRSIVDGP
ncbi:MAG: hypothetical protein OEW98_12315, partial [Betaproteobacteria bacterium]|nr:hypothetical protein [Betaproteobacteria bacterium]